MVIFSGSLYNKAWLIHGIVSEAIERLLMERFIREVGNEAVHNNAYLHLIRPHHDYHTKTYKDTFTASSIFLILIQAS